MKKWNTRELIKVSLCLMFFLMIAFAFGQQASSNQLEMDEFDQLRMKWRYYLTGEDKYELPVTDPNLLSRIDGITSNGQIAWNGMNKEEGRTYLWEEVTPAKYPDSSYIYENYRRLYRMALAYSTKGSMLEGDPALLNDTIQGLDWMYAHQYNEQLDWKVNYHHWEINIPTILSNTTTLLYEPLGETRVNQYMSAVHKFANNPTTYALSVTPSYGANRLSESLPIALRGILVKDGSRLALVRDRLGDTDALIYPFVKEGNGWYRDGSFISHDRHAYNGTYGMEQYSILITLMYMLDGSAWEITDSRISNVYDWTNDGYLPLIHKGRMMDIVNGRATARQGSSDHAQGNKLIDSLLILSDFASEQNAAMYKQAIKEWVQGKGDFNYRSTASIPMLLRVNEILQDDSILASTNSRYMQYSAMDRAVQQRPEYAFGLSMFSNRIYDFETVNGENKKGWYTSSGMTYIYDRDYTQFNENYWATINMKRLPGITVDAEYDRPESDSNKRSTKSWVGGVEISDLYGASGMELEGIRTTLNAKKSWFAFDDEIVALGSDINSQDGRTIETIVDNRRLNSSSGQILTVNGETQSTTIGWNAQLNGVTNIHLEGRADGAGIGYVFPEANTTIHALHEERSGTWNAISSQATDTAVYSNPFLNLWFDHGQNPVGAQYAYIMLPERSVNEVSQYASEPDVTILEKSEYVHAVRENNLNITAALFWDDVKRTVDQLITVDKKAAIAVRESGGKLEVNVSDPTHENRGIIEVEIHRSAASVVSKDPSIKVLRLAPTIQIAVQTNGSLGVTQSIIFDTTDATATEALILTPVADAAVHSGSHSSDNFGYSTTISARDAGEETKNRRTYLKFDLTGVNRVDRAILRVNTSNPAGAYAVMNALGSGNGWTEHGITWNNAPSYESSVLDNVTVNAMEQYYELDVTEYVRRKALDEGFATLVVTGTDYENVNLALHSREHSYRKPQLVIEGEFSSGTSVIPEYPSYGNMISLAVDEHFDSTAAGSEPQGWAIASTGGQATVIELAGAMNDRDLELNGGTDSLTAALTFEPQEGLVYAEFRMRAERAAEPLYVNLNGSGSENESVQISFNGQGRITASDGNSTQYMQGYTLNVWYKVKLLIDTETGVYDIYIDEARKGSRLSLAEPVGSIGEIEYVAGSNGKFYIDDVLLGIADSMEPAPTEYDLQNRDASDASLPNYTVNDHFNISGNVPPAGWAIGDAGGIVTLSDQPNGENRSLSIMNTQSGTTSATRLFDATDKDVAVEFWLKPEQSNQTFGAPYVRDAGNRDIAIVLFGNNGNISAFNGSTSINLSPYSAGEWYHMRFEFDASEKTFDLYINGRLAADNFAYRNASSTGVSRLFYFSNATAGVMQIDNVRVITEDDSMTAPAPGTTPALTIQTPETARPGEALQVQFNLQSMGYQVQPERVVLSYDVGVLSYEGLEGGAPEADYHVYSGSMGELVLTWTKGIRISESEGLPRLNFRVKDQPNATSASIQLFTSELYLLPDGIAIRTPKDVAELSIDANVSSYYTVNDDFNESEIPAGWMTNQTGGTVELSNTPDNGNRYLSMINTGAGQTAASRVFDTLNGNVTVEYWVKPDQQDQTFGAPYLKDALDRDTAVILFINNGTLQAFNGAASAATTLLSYQAGEWYHMRLELNTNARTYDLYVNGQLMADDFGFRNPSSTGISKLHFFSNAAAGTMHLDNVRVISEQDVILGPSPEDIPALTLQAPEQAVAGERIGVRLNLENRGYEVRPERIIISYDKDLFDFEEVEGGDMGLAYSVNKGIPGYLAITWAGGSILTDNEQLPILNFRVKEATAASEGSIRLFAAELYLLAESSSIRTLPDEIAVQILVDQTAPVIEVNIEDEAVLVNSEEFQLQVSVTDDGSGVDNSQTVMLLNGQPIEQDTIIKLYLLPLGANSITISASDLAGNIYSKTITFYTETSVQALIDLVEKFAASGAIDNHGIVNSLLQKLSKGDLTPLLNQLMAQRGKHIHAEEADILIRDTNFLLN